MRTHLFTLVAKQCVRLFVGDMFKKYRDLVAVAVGGTVMAIFGFGGRRRKKLVAVENVRLLVKLFMCCVGVDKKSLFERPNFGVGQSILRVLGTWSRR